MNKIEEPERLQQTDLSFVRGDPELPQLFPGPRVNAHQHTLLELLSQPAERVEYSFQAILDIDILSTVESNKEILKRLRVKLFQDLALRDLLREVLEHFVYRISRHVD